MANTNEPEETGWQQIAGQLQGIVSSMLTQGALLTVSEFTGTEDITSWLVELDKAKAIHGLADSNTNQLAWSRSRGPASAHIGRILSERPQITWGELKTDLEREYGSTVDAQQAFSVIKNLRQRKNESISNYSERLMGMADKVYGTAWKDRENKLVNDQLASIFLDGLTSFELKTRLYTKGIPDFMGLVVEAKKDDMVKKRFPGGIDRREEPMEIDHRRRRGCYNCRGPHRAKDCPRQEQFRRKPEVRVLQTEMTLPPARRTEWAPRENTLHPSKTEWTSRGYSLHPQKGNRRPRDENSREFKEWMKREDLRQRRCFRCHRTGHFVARCQENLNC